MPLQTGLRVRLSRKELALSSNPMDEHRLVKLPKWAIAHIDRLERDKQDLHDALAKEWVSHEREGKPHVEVGYGVMVDKPPRRIKLRSGSSSRSASTTIRSSTSGGAKRNRC